MNQFSNLYWWELRALLRFPMLEVLVAFFVFQAFSLSTWTGSQSMPPGSLWEGAAAEITFRSSLSIFSKLAELYIPAAIFTSIFVASAFTYDFESGQMKVLLSHPVSRRSVFLAKLAAIVTPILLLTFGSILFATLASNPQGVASLLHPSKLGWVWAGVFLACLVLALTLTCLAVFIAVVSRNSALTIAAGMALFLGVLLAGDASRALFLPPQALARTDGLLFLANRLPPQVPIFVPLVSTYLAVGLVAGAVAYWVFVRRVEVA